MRNPIIDNIVPWPSLLPVAPLFSLAVAEGLILLRVSLSSVENQLHRLLAETVSVAGNLIICSRLLSLHYLRVDWLNVDGSVAGF